MQYPKSGSVSTRIDIFECNFLGHALETSPEIWPMNGLQLMSSMVHTIL